MRIHDRQDPQLVAEGELVMNKIHSPDIVRSDCLLAIIAQLGLHPTFWILVPELQTQLIVNPARLLDVHLPALPSQQDMDTPISVATLGIVQRWKWDITWLPGMDQPGDPIAVGNRLREMVRCELLNV